jgi:hypothetical protein
MVVDMAEAYTTISAAEYPNSVPALTIIMLRIQPVKFKSGKTAREFPDVSVAKFGQSE